jgi:hypothetical protein
MKVDQIVIDRLNELLQEGDKLTYRNVVAATAWITSATNVIERSFGSNSEHYKSMLLARKHLENSYLSGALDVAKGVTLSAKNDYERGVFFSIVDLVSADVADDYLDQATKLLDGNYKQAACIIAGVALEVAIKRLCDHHGIPHASFETMNSELKRIGIYSEPKRKLLSGWYGLRSSAAHGDDVGNRDVASMINEVRIFVADFLG